MIKKSKTAVLMKKIIVKIGILITLTLLIIVGDYVRINTSYFINKNKYEDVYNIPGNTSNYVPQGLSYSEKYNVILQTSYNSKKSVSMLYVIDLNTKKVIKELKLIEVDDRDNINHVGGITTNDDIVWIVNDYEINEFSLEEIVNTNQDFIKSKKNQILPNRGDFCYYNDNILWVGDFFFHHFYKVPNNNPLLMGYRVSSDGINFFNPDYIISLPKMVQGMAITPDNHFVFTRSASSLLKSDLVIYKNVLKESYEYYSIEDKKVPYYKFTKSDLIRKVKLPPMAEGVFYRKDEFYVLFESGANTYFYADPKMDKVIKFRLNN